MRHRYFCAECPNHQRYGPWRDTASDANRDARDHRNENEGHYPYL